MHYRSLLRVLSVLLSIIGGFLAVMATFSRFGGEAFRVTLAFLVPAAAAFAFMIGMGWLCRNDGKPFLTNREGFLFVTLSWVLSSLLGAVPFLISGVCTSFFDALYETMSGFTTTGASIFGNVEALPRSILLWRATTHWLGGMGIVVLTVAIFPLLGFGGLRLMEAEAPGPSVDKVTPRVSATAKIFWYIYLGFTLAEIILLMLGGMPLFDAVCHSFATLATGGFGIKNASVGHYASPYIDTVITVFMLLAGANFTLYFRLLKGQVRPVFKDPELRAYLLFFLIPTGIITIDLLNHGVFADLVTSFRFAGLQAASILTTTGFATFNFATWPHASQLTLVFLMFIGGCAGSTAGGIKVVRILTLAKMAFSEMRYLSNPRGVYSIFLNGRHLRKNVVYDTAALVFLYFAIMIVSFLVVGLGGYDLTTSVTATLANLGNIGPGLGPVGPAGNYAFFPWWIKLWLTFTMLVGRLEVYTVLVLFTRRFWRS